MNDIMFWLQPVVAAFTGWFTTWIAIYMLFHPRNAVRFMGITIQGIFPKRQKLVAEKLGGLVARELIHFDEIAARLKDNDLLAELNPTIEKHLDHFLSIKLQEKLPVIATFVGETTMLKIKEAMMEEIALLLPVVISQYTDSLSKKIDIEQIVAEKIATLSSDRLEQMLAPIIKKELRSMKILGALAGFIIGAIQLALSLL